MLIPDDELGIKGFGPFMYPKGAPIVGAEEVKKNHNNNNIRFFVANEISKTIGVVVGFIKEDQNSAINGEPNPIISQIERAIGQDGYPQRTFEFVN